MVSNGLRLPCIRRIFSVNLRFDLLDDPIPDNFGKPGASGHLATAENVNKVRLLLIAGKEKKAIAAQLGITVPTLTKHHFRSGAIGVNDERQRALADAHNQTPDLCCTFH